MISKKEVTQIGLIISKAIIYETNKTKPDVGTIVEKIADGLENKYKDKFDRNSFFINCGFEEITKF